MVWFLCWDQYRCLPQTQVGCCLYEIGTVRHQLKYHQQRSRWQLLFVELCFRFVVPFFEMLVSLCSFQPLIRLLLIISVINLLLVDILVVFMKVRFVSVVLGIMAVITAAILNMAVQSFCQPFGEFPVTSK